MKITKWSPDTCDCVIEYEWDETLPIDEIVHTQKSITTCEHHSHMDDVVSENQNKNKVLKKLLDMASVEDKEVDSEGNEKFKKEPKWSFDEDRNLVVELEDKTKLKEIEDEINKEVSVKLK